nr:MAG TPA: hypothetical protein [Caudoviricetes sp.]
MRECVEQSPHLCICTFDAVCSYTSSLIYSFIAIIFINDYSPLIIYNYVKVSFI